MRLGRSMTAAHHGTPLVVRASLPRTFLGLELFVEGSLLFAGVYLLSEVLKRPLEAQQGAVIGAGVLLSLATVLLFYLAWPRRYEALAREDDPSVEERRLEPPLPAYGESDEARQRAEAAMIRATQLPEPM
jgi:hypothetical protein